MADNLRAELITIVSVKWEKRQYPWLRVKGDDGSYYTVDKHSLWDKCGVASTVAPPQGARR